MVMDIPSPWAAPAVMRSIGDLRYYSEEETLSLSQMDRDTMLFCVQSAAVQPQMTNGQLEFVESDVLILKLIQSLVFCKRALRASERLRRHFGLSRREVRRVAGSVGGASVIAALVDRLLTKE